MRANWDDGIANFKHRNSHKVWQEKQQKQHFFCIMGKRAGVIMICPLAHFQSPVADTNDKNTNFQAWTRIPGQFVQVGLLSASVLLILEQRRLTCWVCSEVSTSRKWLDCKHYDNHYMVSEMKVGEIQHDSDVNTISRTPHLFFCLGRKKGRNGSPTELLFFSPTPWSKPLNHTKNCFRLGSNPQQTLLWELVGSWFSLYNTSKKRHKFQHFFSEHD